MELCARAGLRFSVFDPFPDSSWLPFPMFAAARDPQVTNVAWDPCDDRTRVFDLTAHEIWTEKSDGVAPRWGQEAAPEHVAPSVDFKGGYGPVRSATPRISPLRLWPDGWPRQAAQNPIHTGH